MTYTEAFALLWEHLWGALGIGMVFGAGMLLAAPVMRKRIGPLLFFPGIFANMLHRILGKNLSTIRLALFVFFFNSCAIFLYMLTGIVPFAPAVVAIWAGLNVALTSIIAQKRFPRADLSIIPIPLFARIGAVLTFALEIPSLCFALAMGMTIQTRFTAFLRGVTADDLRQRVLAYVMVLVPILALSALAEAHAVCSAFAATKAGTPPENDQ